MSFAYSNSRFVPGNLARATAKYQDLASRVGYYLLILIAVCSPWGDVLRLPWGSEFWHRGLTTAFAVFVVLISLLSTKFFTAIISRPRVLFFWGFLLLGIVASFLHNVPFDQSIQSGLNRGGYWILMIAVLSLMLDARQGRIILQVFAISTALMCVVSIVDYYGMVNIPGFNEGRIEFGLDKGTAKEIVGRSLIGPFRSRSIFAPYAVIAWSVSLVELIQGKFKNVLKVAFWSSIIVVLTFSIVIGYSRAAYVAIVIGGLYAVYMSDFRKMLRILFLVAPLAVLFVVVVSSRFPHETEVLTRRITSLGPERFVEEGGHYRIGLLQATITDLMRNPLGMGYGMVEYNEARWAAHSIFLEYVRPAGVLGLACVVVFMWPVLKTLIDRHLPPEINVSRIALVGALAYGLSHSTHNMLMGWVVIAFLYGSSGKTTARQPQLLPVASVDSPPRRRRRNGNGGPSTSASQ